MFIEISVLSWVVKVDLKFNILLFQKSGNTVLKDDYEPSTYASVSGKLLCASYSFSMYCIP
jgi:hypothetical protein